MEELRLGVFWANYEEFLFFTLAMYVGAHKAAINFCTVLSSEMIANSKFNHLLIVVNCSAL